MNAEKERIEFVARIIKSNKDFDAIHFFEYINFVVFDKNYYNKVIDLTIHYNGDSSDIYKIIKDYMDVNYIKEIAPLDFENLYDQEVYINNVLITNDMINKVIEFMKINNFPMINYIYGMLISRYIYKGTFE